ncbi:MAG: methyltransferase, partial [Pseudomonadota bacterium]
EYDMFLNIRNYHNLSMDDRAAFNKAVYDSLKPGGPFVIIDHTRRHMQDDDPENWRREDPVLVLVEVQDAGFELEKYSDMFYRADDTLEYEVGRRTVTGNTDRFFFVFRKP